MRFKLSSALWACAFVALASHPLPALADDAMVRATNSSIIIPANAALRAIIAQGVPVGTPEKPISAPGLPTGFTYTLDASMAWSEGKTGAARNALPGGIDAVVGFGFNKHNRLQIGYYQVQEYPFGFNTGTVPVFLQGLGAPIGTQNLAQLGTDVTTKDKLFTITDQNLFIIAHKLPIIISPTYIARTANVGGFGDTQTIEINGFPQTVHLRSDQSYLLPVTLPFLSTPRMFGTVTAAGEWNVNLNGANAAGNKMQIFELAYLEYRLSKKTTLFIQPSRLIDYLPPDPYPQYIPTMIWGASHKFTKNTFVQVLAETGTPSNRQTLGITSLTCLQIASNGQCTTAVPAISGLRATQVQLQFGIGSPSVIPL